MERWCRERGREVGGVLSLAQAWQLAVAWYADRLSPGWRRKPAGEAQAVFDGLGLTGDFWRLA